MNNYLIIFNENAKSQKIKNKLESLFDDTWINNPKKPEYIFIIGGDGTFLRNLNKISKFPNAKVIPINGGTVGFYSYFNSNLTNILKKITDQEKYFKPTIINLFDGSKKYISINEILITSTKTLELDIKINNIKYEKFIGTGFMISTPTGSTGRNKSAGGAVIFPGIDVVQLLEVEPISQKKFNTLRSPVILRTDCNIKASVASDNKQTFLVIDGDTVLQINKKVIDISFDKSDFFLYKPCNTKSYISKLRNTYTSGA
ncbi:MAG: hypothetical protein ACRDCF_01990 [Mycoplasmoidaceae bacterium]